MRGKSLSLMIMLSVLLVCSSNAVAEQITLKSGKVFSGEILSHSSREFEIQTENGLMQIPYRMVAKIEVAEDKEPYPMIEDIKKKLTVVKAKDQRRNRLYAQKKVGKKVELYMTTWCPYCRKMENYLRKIGANYKKYNIEHDRAANRRYKKMRGKGVPLVKIGNKIIRGYDTQSIDRALR